MKRAFWFTAALLLILTACMPAQPTVDLPAVQGGSAPTAETKDGYPAPTVPTAYPGAQQAAPTDSAYPAAGSGNTNTLTALPASTTFKVPDVDRVLTSLFDGNSPALNTLIAYIQVACTKAAGVGGPPKCKDSEADGTKVDVLPTTGGQDSFLRKDDANLKDLRGSSELLGVFQVKAGAASDPANPSGAYGIVLGRKDPAQVVLLRVDASGIVRADYLLIAPTVGQLDIDHYLTPAQ